MDNRECQRVEAQRPAYMFAERDNGYCSKSSPAYQSTFDLRLSFKTLTRRMAVDGGTGAGLPAAVLRGGHGGVDAEAAGRGGHLPALQTLRVLDQNQEVRHHPGSA